MFSDVSSTEIVLLAIVLLVFFGGNKLPEFTKGIGEALSEFRRASQEKV